MTCHFQGKSGKKLSNLFGHSMSALMCVGYVTEHLHDLVRKVQNSFQGQKWGYVGTFLIWHECVNTLAFEIKGEIFVDLSLMHYDVYVFLF